MYIRLFKNDIRKSKLTAFATLLFIIAAAALVSLAAALATNLFGAIDGLMAQAKTPHFLQMHSGTIDTDALANFAAQNDNVNEYQVLPFLNIDGAKIQLAEGTLASSVQDNGLCVQSQRFDFLLDLDGEVILPSDGEIYIPLSYAKDGSIHLTDSITIGEKTLTVAGFLRDSQMNSTLSSSKRFLVSANDFEAARTYGNVEYLIEFLVKDLSGLAAFESAYASAGLPANGPAITYPLFRMVNAISDGITIAVILLISFLVLAIAFLCIRFTLLAKIEDEYREIGVMKGIGIRISSIRKLYMAKYAAISAIGCTMGFAVSMLFKEKMLENIRLYMGLSENAELAVFFSAISCVLVMLCILLYIRSVLRRFKKLSAASAIRFGASKDTRPIGKAFRLSKNMLLSTNVFLGVKEILARKKLYITMFAVLSIAVFIINVPWKLHRTISSSAFFGYMGVGNCDLRIDIQQTDSIAVKAAEIAGQLESDPFVSDFTVLTTKTVNMIEADGKRTSLKVEIGDLTKFSIPYLSGKPPEAENEIAFSIMNADDHGKSVGDPVLLLVDGETKSMVLSGIYSDITNGGKTAKAVFTDSASEIMWASICVRVTDKSAMDSFISKYQIAFPYAKVSDIEAYSKQMFGTTVESVKAASYLGTGVALLVSLFVTLLFTKVLIAKDRQPIAALKAIGFRSMDIQKQMMTRLGFVLLLALIIGTLLSDILGEMLAGLLISSFGAAKFQFVANPVLSYLLCPVMMCAVVLLASGVGLSSIKNIQIYDNIKE